jgi:sterol desaturase/sphingolipid hydroxylase (fatty acid hydroxylase superfamily)
MKRVLAVLAFPVLLLGSAAAVHLLSAPLGRDLAFAAVIAATSVALLLLERVIPYRAAWRPSRRELVIDLTWVVVTIATSALTQLAVTRLVPAGALAASMDLLPAAIVAVVLGDLGPYWVHRISHEKSALLWAVHAVHHSPDKLHFWNASRLHPINVAYNVALRAATLRLLGFSDAVVLIAGTVGMVVNAVSHTNAALELGPLNLLFSGPEVHRVHHERDLSRGNANYGGVVMIWDILFGTDHRPIAQYDPGIGGAAPRETWCSQLLFPFRSCCAKG